MQWPRTRAVQQLRGIFQAHAKQLAGCMSVSRDSRRSQQKKQLIDRRAFK